MCARKNESRGFAFYPFEDLKKIIENKGIQLAGRNRAPEEEKPVNDEEFFLNAMSRVREIREFRRIPIRQKKVPVYKNTSSDRDALKALEEIVSGVRPVNLSKTQEYVQWIHPDFRRDVISKLEKGQCSVQDCLDLHGLITDEAEVAVEHFLKDSMKKGYRCIKVIHGRGRRSAEGPVLKEAVIKWLSGRYRKYIVAFVTARQCDGGLGALYVLLR